jgi:hypothetical protein
MVVIESYNSDEVQSKGTGGGDREHIKLDAGQKISGVELIDASCGESDYGPYVLIGMKDDDGTEYSMLVGETNVFGRNCIETFTTGDSSFRNIKDSFKGKKIWIGKSKAIKAKKGTKSYFALEWNFCE